MTASAPGATPWVLPAELTIYQVGELRPLWLAELATHQQHGWAVTLDARDVEQVDGAGLQLLCALRRSVLHAGLAFELHDPAPALAQGLQGLGILPSWSQHP